MAKLTKRIVVRMTPKMHARLTREARRAGIPFSWMVRIALGYGLDAVDSEQKEEAS